MSVDDRSQIIQDIIAQKKINSGARLVNNLPSLAIVFLIIILIASAQICG